MQTTFTPLARGRYRCNQTGKVYKQPQLEAVRNARAGVRRRKLPKPVVQAVKPEQKSYYDTFSRMAFCPNWQCDEAHKRGPGSVVLCVCGTKFEVVELGSFRW